MKTFLFLLSISLSVACGAQDVISTSQMQANAEKDASAMIKHVVAGDYSSFMTYIYPPLVEMGGGADKMLAAIEEVFSELDKEGITLDSMALGRISTPIKVGAQLQCTIEEFSEMRYKDTKIKQVTTLIGLSDNNGKSWTFIESNGKSLKELQAMVPQLSNDLFIPAEGEPEIIKE